MTNPSASWVTRRNVPGTSRWLSDLAISLDPPAVAPPAADAREVALLRRIRERGVTTFDVGRARFPARAERLIATAFPAPDPELGVIVGRSVESLAAERDTPNRSTSGGSLAAALEASFEASQRRLAPATISVVEWDPGPRPGSKDSELALPLPLTKETDSEPIWATRLPSPASALPESALSPALFAGEFSLLDDSVVSLFDRANPNFEAKLIARNPFSDGRLDGSRFAATSMLGGPGERPVDVRRLHQEFDPILRLGFLTESRRRTLAQAALRFVLGWPWVVSCVVPLPAPERCEEILGFASTPPLDDDELARLGLLK